jgi:hypothetical protein
MSKTKPVRGNRNQGFRVVTLTKKQLSDLEDVLGFVMCHYSTQYEKVRALYGPGDPVTKSHIYLKALHAYAHIREAV